MGIFTFWREKKSDSGSITIEQLREIAVSGGSKSGVNVNWKTALRATTYLACVRVIAEGLAQVPCKLQRARADGRGSDPARDDSMFDLLRLQPNELQTAFEFWEQRGLHLAVASNAYALKVRVGGRVIELLPYEPGQVKTIRRGWDIAYQVQTVDGRTVTIPKEDMWHTRGLSWDGVIGLDAIRLAREAIGLSLATEQHGALLFANGAQPGGLLSTESTLTKDQLKMLKESWQEANAGGKKFSTAVLFGGMKWSPMTAPNDQTQFLETRRLQVEEICRAMRVLPIMVGHSDKTQTFASSEQMFIAHAVHTMGPWYRRCEQSADLALLTSEQRKKGLEYKFAVNALMRGAAKDRADFYTKLYNVGALNPNEIRELEDMNPYDGGEEYRVPLNMTEPGKEPADDSDVAGGK